jgi:hypothetical protein
MLLAELADAAPDNLPHQRDLSVRLNKLGDTRAAQGDLAGALAAFEQGLAIRERLAEADPSNAQWQTDVVVSLWKLAGDGLAEPAAARDYLRRVLAILEGLAAAGRLHGAQQEWPALIGQRLEALAAGGE